MRGQRRDLIGQRFARLLVVARSADSLDGRARWCCRCDCGNEIVTLAQSLLNCRTRSCGCLNLEVATQRSTTHGRSTSRAYRVWAEMLQRCTNPKRPHYERYGGRGISVCARWMKFENFFADMGERPRGLTLERIDNDGNYEPDNCRWATRLEQGQNTRTNRRVVLNGETLSLSELSRRVGIRYTTLRGRLNRGLSIEECVKR